MLKNEIGKFYDVEPVMDKKCFIELLVLELANNHTRMTVGVENNIFIDKEEKVAQIPFNYKEEIKLAIINNPIKYAKVINILELFDNQSVFDSRLNQELDRYLNVRRNHDYKVDFENETFEVTYSKEALQALLVGYDEETLSIMNDLANIVSKRISEEPLSLTKQDEEQVTTKKTGKIMQLIKRRI